jgi:thymidine phosphorylase
VKLGEFVRAGALLARVHAADTAQADAACARLKAALALSDNAPAVAPLVCEVIGG